jgi:hypothetical protein
LFLTPALPSGRSTSYHSGSSLRMSCPFTGPRRHSSVCLSSGAWTSGLSRRSLVIQAAPSLFRKYLRSLPAGLGTGSIYVRFCIGFLGNFTKDSV